MTDSARSDSAADAITVDLRGLRCPLPALRTRKALSRVQPGAVLVVECTDPLAAIDIPNLVRETGDILEENVRRGDVLVFRIRRSGGRDPLPSRQTDGPVHFE